jgi:hypothetical protein
MGVALGPDADTAALRRVTETLLVMKDCSAASFKQFFKWLSASISTASQRIGDAPAAELALPELPRGLEVSATYRRPPSDRFVFLHAKCVNDSRFYLIRYEKVPTPTGAAMPVYAGVCSHVVDNFQLDGERTATPAWMDSSRLTNAPRCPHCENEIWALCSCGRVHCCPSHYAGVPLTCPWCATTQVYQPGAFDIATGVG